MISLTDGSQIGVASQGLPFSSCFVSLSLSPPPPIIRLLPLSLWFPPL